MSAPSHYLNQCWTIVNWTLGNKLPWNLNRDFWIFIQENTFENVVWKMAAILSWLQYVNTAQPRGICSSSSSISKSINSVFLNPPDKIAAISQTMISGAFSCMRNLYFDQISLKFVPNGPIGIDNGMAPNRRQAIIRNNADPIPDSYIHH